MIYVLNPPIQVGDFSHQITVHSLKLVSVSLNFEPLYTAQGAALLSICLIDPVSGYPVNVVYNDPSVVSLWAGIEGAMLPLLFGKMIADNKLPSGAILDNVSTTIILSAAAAEITRGASAALTASLPAGIGGVPDGSVSFKDGDAELEIVKANNGVAVCYPVLSLGSHTLTAILAAADGFTGSVSASITVTVVEPVVPISAP